MKLSLANQARARYISALYNWLLTNGEDVGQTASNIVNFPFVEDGEEGVMEIVVKVVKKGYDECMQERLDYSAKVEEKAEKALERERVAAERKAKAKAKAEAAKPEE